MLWNLCWLCTGCVRPHFLSPGFVFMFIIFSVGTKLPRLPKDCRPESNSGLPGIVSMDTTQQSERRKHRWARWSLHLTYSTNTFVTYWLWVIHNLCWMLETMENRLGLCLRWSCWHCLDNHSNRWKSTCCEKGQERGVYGSVGDLVKDLTRRLGQITPIHVWSVRPLPMSNEHIMEGFMRGVIQPNLF